MSPICWTFKAQIKRRKYQFQQQSTRLTSLSNSRRTKLKKAKKRRPTENYRQKFHLRKKISTKRIGSTAFLFFSMLSQFDQSKPCVFRFNFYRNSIFTILPNNCYKIELLNLRSRNKEFIVPQTQTPVVGVDQTPALNVAFRVSVTPASNDSKLLDQRVSVPPTTLQSNKRPTSSGISSVTRPKAKLVQRAKTSHGKKIQRFNNKINSKS